MYFITAMTYPKIGELGWPEHRSRCFGYYPDLETAEERLRRNTCDIHECRYTIAVIEKIGPGIHADQEEQGWFRYVEESDSWEPTERPKELEGICWFAF